jgi:hypothetical protein
MTDLIMGLFSVKRNISKKEKDQKSFSQRENR